MLPFPFPHMNCHYGWQLLGVAILSVHRLEMDTTGDMWRKEKGEPFSIRAMGKLSQSSGSFPTDHPKSMCTLFFSVVQDHKKESNEECPVLEFPSKLQNNVQNTTDVVVCANSWWITADQVLCFQAAVPFALLQQTVIKALSRARFTSMIKSSYFCMWIQMNKCNF